MQDSKFYFTILSFLSNQTDHNRKAHKASQKHKTSKTQISKSKVIREKIRPRQKNQSYSSEIKTQRRQPQVAEGKSKPTQDSRMKETQNPEKGKANITFLDPQCPKSEP